MALGRPGPSMGRAERLTSRSATLPPSADAAVSAKKKISPSAAWREARELIRVHKQRLALGLVLMMISRLAGLVLPLSSKYVIDEVIGNKRYDLLLPIAMAGGV